MKNQLELRMYGFVPYNISEIQKGIQFGHAVVEYGQMAKSENSVADLYDDWADRWKTFIILNGGTSNHSLNRYHHHDELEFQGTMESNLATLMLNEIKVAAFYEPDMNDMLSAIVFIVDERVFNRKDYPDFGDWMIANHFSYFSDNMMNAGKIEKMRREGYFANGTEKERKLYSDWVDLIGGEKNLFLRDFLKNFKMA